MSQISQLNNKILAKAFFVDDYVFGKRYQIPFIAISEVQIGSVVTIEKRSLRIEGGNGFGREGRSIDGDGLGLVGIDEIVEVGVGGVVFEIEGPD